MLKMYAESDLYKKSVYGKSYMGKTTDRISYPNFPNVYPDAVAGPFSEYLVLEKNKQKLHQSIPYEHHDEVTKRIMNTNPFMEKYFQEPIKIDVINKMDFEDYHTIYEVEIGDLELLQKMKREPLRVPNDFFFPKTTYRRYYQHPNSGPFPAEHVQRAPPLPNGIKISEKARELMGVTTGESEYMATIGHNGQLVMDYKPFGNITRAKWPEIDHNDPFNEKGPYKIQDSHLCKKRLF